MKSKNQDAVLMSSATVVGIAFVFVFLTAKDDSAGATVLGVVFGLILLAIGLSLVRNSLSRSHRRPVISLSDSATVFPNTTMDIVFSPQDVLNNPKLTLLSRTSKIEVVEVWHDGIATLSGKPRPIYYWHTGQPYPGIVDSRSSLIVRLTNLSTKPAVVAARLSGYQERRRIRR
jgi:hypothetical protein